MVSGTNLNQTLTNNQLATIQQLWRCLLWLPLFSTSILYIVACYYWQNLSLAAIYILVVTFFTLAPYIFSSIKRQSLHNCALILLKTTIVLSFLLNQIALAFILWLVSWLYFAHTMRSKCLRWGILDLGLLAIILPMSLLETGESTTIPTITSLTDGLLVVIAATLLLALIFALIAKIQWFKKHLFLYNQGLLSATIIHQLQQPLQYCYLELDDIVNQYQNQGPGFRQSSHQKNLLKRVQDINQQVALAINVMRCYQPLRDQSKQNKITTINNIVRQVLKIVSCQMEEKQVKVIVRADTNTGTTAHPCLLCQVLINLIINAVEAFPKPQPLVTKSETTRRMIKIALYQYQGGTSITITDNGPGIHQLNKLGLPPSLLNNNHYHLGLYLAKTIIETELAGSLKIKSQPGQGTTIKILLPNPNH